MKYATEIKITQADPQDSHILCGIDGQPIFFAHMAKVAGITRKEFQYQLSLSKTIIDGWFSGERIDPFTRARQACALFRKDLVPHILAFIAGGNDFDGRVLTAEENAALNVLIQGARK